MENLSNGYTTTINHVGGYISTDTVITVTSVIGAPSPNFRILIDDEYMLVTGVSGNDLTVTRAVEGSTAVSHANGSAVVQILTLGGLYQYIVDRFPPSSGGTLSSRVAPITPDTDGSTITFNCANYDWHSVTLGGNRTLALSNVSIGQQITLRLKQDGAGSRLVTWFSGISWFTNDGNAPILPTAANKVIVVTLKCTASGAYDGFVAGIQS